MSLRSHVIQGLLSLHQVARSRTDLIDASGLVAVVDHFSYLNKREATSSTPLDDKEWEPLGAVVSRVLVAAGLPGIVAQNAGSAPQLVAVQ